MSAREYDKQGNDFLNKYGISMLVKFVKYDKHFPEDIESRDIYRISFKRYVSGKPRSFGLTFGQSLKDSTRDGGYKPNAYDVLACLTKEDPHTYESFCGNFGYNVDSITALRTYKACVKEWKNIHNFFDDSELEELREIQ